MSINGSSVKKTRLDDNEETESIKVKNWKTKTSSEKLKFVLSVTLKPIALIGCLYFFICSLELMSSAFRLIGGRYASEAFQSNVILTNPLAGLVIGVVVTVIVQSSSTATSIVVSMVASEIIKVKYAIPIIMGSNVGTSITSTLVSLGQLGNKDEFERAFAGATVHDMFNCLSVLIILPLEIASGYLDKLTKLIVTALLQQETNVKEPEMLSALTKPFTHLIMQLDKEALEVIASGNASETLSLMKHNCNEKLSVDKLNNLTSGINTTTSNEYVKCQYLFESLKIPEWAIGLILLLCSLAVLCACLVGMVKILNSAFQGPVARLLQRVVNADFPGPFRHLTGYFAILLGCVLTVIIQSSSVFTSTLTPLVGLGLVTVERVYPLTLGSNIGTTITGILAAFSAPYRTLKYSLQIALCHTLFNVTGIAIWFPIPILRRVPINLAKGLGKISAEYRWFPLVYLLGLFFFIPIVVFSLSIAGWVYLGIVLCPIALLIISVILINFLQNKKPNILPEFLRNWQFLPLPLRSLEVYDRLLFKYVFCCKCCNRFKIAKTQSTILSSLNDKTNNNNKVAPTTVQTKKSNSIHVNNSFEVSSL